MATLQIKKKSDKIWEHIDSELGTFIVSKFYFNADFGQFQIVEQGQSKRRRYDVADIEVFDIGGLAETFVNITQLSLRLEELNYVGLSYETLIINGGLDETADHEKGSWNASTNTPALTNGVGQIGDHYRVSVAGTQFSTSWAVDDIIAYDGSVWYKFVDNNQSGGEPFIPKTFSATASQSFGDSITVGSNATAGNSYIERLVAIYGTVNTQRAVSGRGVWESVRSHNLNVNTSHNNFSIVMSGFNDVRRGGNGAKTLNKISNAYRGIVVNQFMKTYINAGSASSVINRVGTWFDYAANTVGGKSAVGKYTLSNGAYIEYTFTDNNVAIGLIGGDGVSEIHGTFDVHIDGVLQGSFDLNNQTDGINDGSNSNTRSPFVLYFSGLEDKQHVIKVTSTSTSTMPVDYFGNLLNHSFCAPLLFMEAPKMNAAGYATAPANASDLIIDQLNTLLNSVVSEFANDFPIFVAKTNDYYDISTGLDTDNIHPNNTGHGQILNAAYVAMKDIIITKSTAASLLGTNNTWTGTNFYSALVKILTGGFQVQSALSAPIGAGVEIEYNGGEGYYTAFDRGASSWKNINIRGAIIKFLSSGTQKAEVNSSGMKIVMPTYADNAAATAGGLAVDQLYKTATGEVRVRV